MMKKSKFFKTLVPVISKKKFFEKVQKMQKNEKFE